MPNPFQEERLSEREVMGGLPQEMGGGWGMWKEFHT